MGCSFPGLLELVVIPGAVNLVTTALYDLIKGAIHRARSHNGSTPGREGGQDGSELELAGTTTGSGDRVVVVRPQRERS